MNFEISTKNEKNENFIYIYIYIYIRICKSLVLSITMIPKIIILPHHFFNLLEEFFFFKIRNLLSIECHKSWLKSQRKLQKKSLFLITPYLPSYFLQYHAQHLNPTKKKVKQKRINSSCCQWEAHVDHAHQWWRQAHWLCSFSLSLSLFLCLCLGYFWIHQMTTLFTSQTPIHSFAQAPTSLVFSDLSSL